MSRSRRTGCPEGRDCTWCGPSAAVELLAQLEDQRAEETAYEAQEYAELPYWPNLAQHCHKDCCALECTCPECRPDLGSKA